jgi:hypothetical protein
VTALYATMKTPTRRLASFLVYRRRTVVTIVQSGKPNKPRGLRVGALASRKQAGDAPVLQHVADDDVPSLERGNPLVEPTRVERRRRDEVAGTAVGDRVRRRAVDGVAVIDDVE